jgi:DNA-binding transcriptional MerR regulator
MTEKNKFQSKDICSILDIPARQLLLWAERGLIVPEHRDAKGRSSSRVYSLKNVVEAGVIKELVSWGMDLSSIKCFLERMKTDKINIVSNEHSSFKVDVQGIEKKILTTL